MPILRISGSVNVKNFNICPPMIHSFIGYNLKLRRYLVALRKSLQLIVNLTVLAMSL